MTSPACRPLQPSDVDTLNTRITDLSMRLLDETADRRLIAEDALEVLNAARAAMAAALTHADGLEIPAKVARQAAAEYKALEAALELREVDGPVSRRYPFWAGRLYGAVSLLLDALGRGKRPDDVPLHQHELGEPCDDRCNGDAPPPEPAAGQEATRM